MTGREMIAITKQPRLLPTCPIGKFKGKPWSQVDAGFLGWMLRQPTMEEDLKWNARREIDEVATICDGNTYLFGGIERDATGVYVDSLISK
jgi:hypothetical protein